MRIHSILKQIREQRGFDIADSAISANISVASLEKIELGKKTPSFNQIENLAKTYGIEPYLLYSEDIPNLPDWPLDFRRSDPGPAKISPSGSKRIWTAEAIAAFTDQLAKVVKYEKPVWASELVPGDATEARAKKLRSYFDEWFLNKEADFGFLGLDEHVFFGGLRIFIELTGVTINVNDAPPEDFIGFYNRNYNEIPSIFINRKIASKKAQLFTLAHELAHHLIRKEGISNPFSVRNFVEKQCNKFAAEFLAPSQDFQKLVESQSFEIRQSTGRLIDTVSKSSLLSRYATAIRLKETGYLNNNAINEWIKKNNSILSGLKEEKVEEKDLAGAGGHIHAKRLSELGYLPTYLAAIAFEKKIIDRLDIQQGMFLADSIQDKTFSLAKRRVAVARA